MSSLPPLDSYPLASLQPAMLVNHLRAPRSGVDVVQMVSTLPEDVDVAAMKASWETVTARHDALRTAFRWEGIAEPMQDVHAAAAPDIAVLDWSDSDAATIASRWTALVADDRTRGFDLRVLPLQRVTLVRISEREWRMMWTFHHILMDGRSFAMVLREVFAEYDATGRGEPAPAPLARRPYREFVEWHRAQDFSRTEPFWRERLRGIGGPTPLPAAFHDVGGSSDRSGRGLHERVLRTEPTAALERMARANGLTMNNVVQGAWALLLARHVGLDDVVFGATRACRKGTIAGADDVIGLFINTAPVRVHVDSELSVVAWLGQLRESWRSLFDVEHTPLRLVQRWSDVRGNAPLFESQIVFENLPLDRTLQADGGAMAARGFHLYGGTNFPLTGLMYGGERLSIEIENERDRIDDVTAERLVEHLATILESFAANPGGLVGEVSMLPEQERASIDAWNQTAVSYPADATLVSLLSEQAARTPDARAVVDEQRTLTYAELDAAATGLARRLRANGVGRGVLVGVCAERSVELVVALVAIVKAGGAYVPLDPDYPRERLAFMLEDAGASVLVAQRAIAQALPPHDATVIWLDDLLESEATSDEALEAPLPDDPAYMIFTSGSTGRPKGALNAHRGIVNRLLWMQDEYRLTPSDVVLQKTPFSFDVSVWEFFWPLLSGATLVMARPGGHREATYLADVISAQYVSVCHFVPSMLRAFLADAGASRCATLRAVMASGEALPPDLVARFYSALPDARLHNLYGPTECAVDVTYWPCPPAVEPPAVVPIGRPVANTRMYVLDALGAPTPIGVPGELHIAGVQVGMGYHGRPELTAEKFLPDPFVRESDARMYRTGDKARWRPDGTLEYLGRFDFQVKLRGFRIELGEIESALVAHPSVREAIVVAREDEAGEPRLVAYVVPEGDAASVPMLREHLAESLPTYMIPAAFVSLAAFPLSSNGKVDRRALPAPELDRQALSRELVAPRTPVEHTLAEIWAQVLRIDQVGVEDNFFELGGDSLLCVQIVSRAAAAGVRITLTQVLRHPTIGALARVAQVSAHAAREPQIELTGVVPLIPVQQWFFEGQLEEAHYWNQAFVFTVPGDVDAVALAEAIAATTRHHDALRLRFERTPDGWRQRVVAEFEPPNVGVHELDTLSTETRQAALEEASTRLQASLDLARGPLLRAALFRHGKGEPARLTIAVHHLAIDGVSWRVLREDIETAYAQRARGETIALPPRTTPFGRWASELVTPAVQELVRDELSYWEQVGSPESLRLPRDMAANDAGVAADADTVVVRLAEAETRSLLQSVPAAYSTQMNDALLSALAEAIGGLTGDGEFVVNVEGHGREDVVDGADLSRTIGWFTTIFPVRLRTGAKEVGSRLRETKEMLRAVPRRGIGYGILRYLGGAETLRAQTTPAMVFNYLGQFDAVLAGSALFGASQDSPGPWYGPRTRRPHLLEVNALVIDGRLEVRWSFSQQAYRRETIARLADAYLSALRTIIAHCTTPGTGGYTPSDFPVARLDQAALDRLVGGQRDVEDVYPVVPMQRLFLGYADAETDPGFEQWRYRLRGPVNVAALRAAWELVVARHAILRTAFASEGLAEPMQIVRRGVSLPWSEYDLRALSADERRAQLGTLLVTDRATGFVYDRAPLMRIMLVRLADDEYELVWSNHHLLLDRWSWPLLLLEIARAYPVIAAGAAPDLAPAPRYGDFVAWQQRQPLAEARTFWARHFDGFDAPPRLAMSNPDADVAIETDEVGVELTLEESREVQTLARSCQVAANAVVEGAWALWLARRGGSGDVSFGVSVAGRDGGVEGIERLVGLTINNLPLRVRIERDAKLGSWLAALHAAQSEVQAFAYAPLDRVQEWSGVPWRTRLFETLLVFQHDGVEEETRSWLGAQVSTELQHVATHTAYPLSVIVAGSDALSLRVTYDPRYFDETSAREMAEGLRAAIRAMVASPEACIADLLESLPEPSAVYAEREWAHEHVAPRTATETVIANVWSDVLGVPNVGTTDNFFALGGYSLVATQIVSRLRASLQLEVPVRLLFQYPTVAALAAALAAREAKPGQLERIATLVLRVLAMSADEVRSATQARAATN